ncbi:hypothetical protein [Thomasclavelia cocleata]|uniref:hypothetical protein n=1 Tax=Thomasclavelia cocleata TaxID=69824 RepID=UPI00242E4309|nr:hypothetical protein [Thomasclavelia cocleata]
MTELNNVSTRGTAWQCVVACALLCGGCGVTPVPGDEYYGLTSGGLAGAASWT